MSTYLKFLVSESVHIFINVCFSNIIMLDSFSVAQDFSVKLIKSSLEIVQFFMDRHWWKRKITSLSWKRKQ